MYEKYGFKKRFRKMSLMHTTREREHPCKKITFHTENLIIILNRCYIELEELGKGRFSVVRKCQEIISGNEVAVKFINRRKQGERIL